MNGVNPLLVEIIVFVGEGQSGSHVSKQTFYSRVLQHEYGRRDVSC